jgi:asparagine synthase (glutamine-hydrolysing)
MAHGVEVRVPFLDLELVNYVNNLPSSFKMNNKQTKLILKDIAREVLPRQIINRKKTGFAVPLRRWILNELADWVDDFLSEEKVRSRGIFNPKNVSQIISMNRRGLVDSSYTIFSLICIELWFREFGISR